MRIPASSTLRADPGIDHEHNHHANNARWTKMLGDIISKIRITTTVVGSGASRYKMSDGTTIEKDEWKISVRPSQ